MTVLIAGGGIAGLALGLTLHQVGVPFRVFEASREMRPLGVGINLQPNAVRELYDLGLEAELLRAGIRTRDYGFYSKYGLHIWTEPRGLWAGYNWPQISIHRGELQLLLYRALVDRAGADAVVLGARAAGYRVEAGRAVLSLADGREATGDLLVAADGIHSAVRAQMFPDEGAPIWNGQLLWRSTTRAPTYLSGASMIMMGHDTQRFVTYPITAPGEDGLATINWIAEESSEAREFRREDYSRTVEKSLFDHYFRDWRFPFIDVPALIEGSGPVFEYPMVDRDPLPFWTQGPVTLMGDAAHPTYPVGSNGASTAIVDARRIGAAMVDHGTTPRALDTYEAAMRPIAQAIITANRGSGPDAVMQMVEDRCGGRFDDIEEVIPKAELAAHAEHYKVISGNSQDRVNTAPPIIAPGARVGAATAS